MKLLEKRGVFILRMNTFLDVGQNFEQQKPFLCDETIDFGALSGFIVDSNGKLEKPTDGFQRVGENPSVSNMN